MPCILGVLLRVIESVLSRLSSSTLVQHKRTQVFIIRRSSSFRSFALVEFRCEVLAQNATGWKRLFLNDSGSPNWQWKFESVWISPASLASMIRATSSVVMAGTTGIPVVATILSIASPLHPPSRRPLSFSN